MSRTDAATNTLPPLFPQGSMLTLAMKLHSHDIELSLLLPDVEWRKLVADFSAMPADERVRVGENIRLAVAHNPFPPKGDPLTLQMQETCDIFVNDCVLLAALAEAVGQRVLMDTAIESYAVLHGNKIRAKLN